MIVDRVCVYTADEPRPVIGEARPLKACWIAAALAASVAVQAFPTVLAHEGFRPVRSTNPRISASAFIPRSGGAVYASAMQSGYRAPASSAYARRPTLPATARQQLYRSRANVMPTTLTGFYPGLRNNYTPTRPAPPLNYSAPRSPYSQAARWRGFSLLGNPQAWQR
jgi:hypothetical protein